MLKLKIRDTRDAAVMFADEVLPDVESPVIAALRTHIVSLETIIANMPAPLPVIPPAPVPERIVNVKATIQRDSAGRMTSILIKNN